MKIVIVIGQLLCGGAEGVVYRLYKQLTNIGFEVKLVVLGEIDTEKFPRLQASDVRNFSPLLQGGKLISNIKRIRFIRGAIKQTNPDVVVSFIDTTNILTILATRFLSIPVVISERNNPDFSTMSNFWYILRKIVYRYADTLVVANKGLKGHCLRRFKLKEVEVIPNLMNFATRDRAPKRCIIAVGSLTQQKRFDLLIEAIYKINQKGLLNGFCLNVFGEGPLRTQLEQLIHQKQLNDIVFLKGQTNDIIAEYAQSEIFVLSSEYEGQPNVLLEAMSLGLSCISTKCNYGPEEIIESGVDGLLVKLNDSNDIALAIEKLISNERLRHDLSVNAKDKIQKQFHPELVLSMWLDLFNKFSNSKVSG